ncbi:MAG TPA: hypothetical protein VG368_01200 [Acidimicrobiales bacterium]|nr:hypothetical protein [Acidimicrobiales bacterium]
MNVERLTAPLVEVLPDVSGVDRPFTYSVGSGAELPAPGTVVSVRLAGRRIRGWVLGPASAPPTATIRSIDRIVSIGPDADVVDLGRFAAQRYAGPLRPFLKSASPDRIVRSLPVRVSPPAFDRLESLVPAKILEAVASAMAETTSTGAVVVQTGPAEPRLGIVAAAACVLHGRDLLVLAPEHRDARTLVERLGRAGVAAALVPEQWPAAAAGGSVVVGTRRAALAPVRDLGAIVVLDSHAESYIEERAPTANATVIATERARRAGVPCLLVSATPRLEQIETHARVTLPGSRSWPALQIVDRTSSDPRSGAYDPLLAAAIRDALDADRRRKVVCVLNRTGRVRLLSCASCGNLQRCEKCGHGLGEPVRADAGAARQLVCPSCGHPRPFVCEHCGSSKLRQLRVGVGRAAEELGALVREHAVEITGGSTEIPRDARLLVGTEAVLHRLPSASLVAFIDFDNELLATRLRASEQAYVLLGRAARLLGGMTGEPHRRIVVQTRLASHPVLHAARTGDPTTFLEGERERRAQLRLPPFAALAVASGEDARTFVEALSHFDQSVEVALRPDGSFLLRAPDHATLLGAVRAARATGVACRIAIDPDDV